MDKVEDPLQSGIQTCWVVNPQRKTVTIYGPGPFSEELCRGTNYESYLRNNR